MKATVRTPAITGLTAFEAVAGHGSFSRAADELSVTQSAVSRRISQLESQLGVTLLMRIGHAVTLTPKGRELLPYVRDGVARVSAAGKPTVRPSLAPAVASNWLIQRLHPDIHIDVLVERQLRDGTLVKLFGLELPSERSYFVATPVGVPRSERNRPSSTG